MRLVRDPRALATLTTHGGHVVLDDDIRRSGARARKRAHFDLPDEHYVRLVAVGVTNVGGKAHGQSAIVRRGIEGSADGGCELVTCGLRVAPFATRRVRKVAPPCVYRQTVSQHLDADL